MQNHLVICKTKLNDERFKFKKVLKLKLVIQHFLRILKKELMNICYKEAKSMECN